MTTLFEAQAIAKSHAESRGEIHPGIYYAIKNVKEYSQYYYFDYFIVDEHGNIPNMYFAGAPGFTVDKQSGEVDVIIFGELSKLK